jgi:REP element-mobilizing transposase RayT
MSGTLSTKKFQRTKQREDTAKANRTKSDAKHGGKRENAGRKKSAAFKYDSSHGTRPELFFKHPVHIMLRTLAWVPRLRQRDGYEAIRSALLHFVEGSAFRIVHISIQNNHLHLVVEAANKDALRRGMQSFSIRAARALNREFERQGKVFAFRYKAKQIKDATYARNVVSYVLNNWRRHGSDKREEGMPFDRYSSAWAFSGWTGSYGRLRDDYGLPVSQPRTPLLVFDWELRGLIDPFERPGQVVD